MIKHEKFGTLLGYAPGNVPVYSSDYDTINTQDFNTRESLRNYVDNIFTGYKWQCVELARRWLYLTKGYIFGDVPMAYDIFNLKYVKNIKTNEKLPLKSFLNGAKRVPEPGCLLIWKDIGHFEITGHVAIVTEVSENYVRVVEQNVDQHIWQEGKNYSRELRSRKDIYGGYWISCDKINTEVLGWVIQTDNDLFSVQTAQPDKNLFNIKSGRIKKSNSEENTGWLNIANHDEEAYVNANGYTLADNVDDQDLFFYISETARNELSRATSELHSMFMHATHLVLKNDELFKRFCIPEIIWPKIQRSWENRKNQMITGRFDFCISAEGIKLYEYNADTCSCYLEAAKIQNKWAEFYNCNTGYDSSHKLQSRLVHTWQNKELDLIHILTDHSNLEEIYHSFFMQNVIENAEIKTIIINDISEINYDSKKQLIDKNGNPIKQIWKTWSWETAMEQLRRELNGGNLNKPHKINLAEILLHEDTLIYEPLWTVVTSNKAMLPFLWELYPNHPYLLNTKFMLNNDLIKSGYVSKPIAGRCGLNIEIVDTNKHTLDKTIGMFDYQQVVYQELFRLPKVNGYNTQICTFSVNGSYAGACTRADKHQIINNNSSIIPLRVVQDKYY